MVTGGAGFIGSHTVDPQFELAKRLGYLGKEIWDRLDARMERVWQRWDGEPEEVNIFGQALDPTRPGTGIWIVGEAKHNLTQREVQRFIDQVERARQHLTGEVFAVCFCYRARPEVQQQIRDAGIRLVFSYGKLV